MRHTGGTSCQFVATLLLLSGLGCRQEPAKPEPAATPPASQPASEPADPTATLRKLLARCHGPGDGRLDRVSLELRSSESASPAQVLLDDRGQLRIRHPDKRTQLLLTDGRSFEWSPGKASRQGNASTSKTLQALQRHLRACLLQPIANNLDHAQVSRQGPKVYRLILPGGETWRLELGDDDLPASLLGPQTRVDFEQHLKGTARLPSVVRLQGIGRRHLQLLDVDVVFDKQVFIRPESRQAKGTFQTGLPPRPQHPTIGKSRPRDSLVVQDPKTWEKRSATFKRLVKSLASRGQAYDGLPFFFEESGKSFMALPFVSAGKDKLELQPGERVLQHPEQQVALVYVRGGTYDQRISAGQRKIQDFLRQRRLTKAGRFRMIPVLALEDGAPSKQQLLEADLYIELPIKK